MNNFIKLVRHYVSILLIALFLYPIVSEKHLLLFHLDGSIEIGFRAVYVFVVMNAFEDEYSIKYINYWKTNSDTLWLPNITGESNLKVLKAE